MQKSHDLIVVGAGIIGLATAFLAREKGMSVHVIEAGDRVAESSVQNFGHACFTAQADVIQPVAAQARAGWLRAAESAGFWAATSGTWLPAATELEMQVLREFSEHRGAEAVRIVDKQEVSAALGNPELAAVGGAHMPNDVRVNPREAAPRLAQWLAENGVDFSWNTQVTAAGDGVVETTRGQFSADRVIVCPGYKLMQIFPELAEKYEVRVCELAMALIARPEQVAREVAVLTGTSMARYDGIAAMPSVPQLREELATREPGLVDCIANLMSTGIEEGLFIGDSHAYSLTPRPFIAEEIASLLLSRGAALYGIENPTVLQRWQGRYADSPNTNLVLEQLDERTTVAVVTSGIGMTLSFGVAQCALDGASVTGF